MMKAIKPKYHPVYIKASKEPTALEDGWYIGNGRKYFPKWRFPSKEEANAECLVMEARECYLRLLDIRTTLAVEGWISEEEANGFGFCV